MAVATLARPQAAQKGEATPAPRSKARAPRRQAAPFGGVLQAKTALGPVNDAYERQADSAAAHVIGRRVGLPHLTALPMSAGAAPGGALAQRACAACEEEKKSRRIQRKCACGGGHDEPCSCKKEEEEHPELKIDRLTKSRGDASGDAIGAVQSVVRTSGRPLPDPVKNEMESGFGRSFSHVRIHDNPLAATSAEGIRAHAYTVGNHIAFNRGKFQPGTDSGSFLLAHELAHTVQQSGAPRADTGRVSQPSDAHETQANRAASAAVSGGPMPALSPGAATISRYDWKDFTHDAADVAVTAVGGPIVGHLVGDAVGDIAVDVVEGAVDVGSEIYQTAVDIANAIGGAISISGTTIIIDIPEFDPCPDLDFSLRLSDIGIDPTLYFPIVAGGFTVGIVTVVGALGIEVNLDPGLGFRLEDCSFGPGQIRINPLSASARVSGMFSVTTSSMVQLGADLGVRGDLIGVIAVPSTPPIVLVVPAVGLSLGGAMEFMLQNRGTLSSMMTASVGLGGVSAAMHMDADVGYGLDFAYGLYGAVSILGMDLCRVGWPLDSIHESVAANLRLDTSMSLSRSGLSFNFFASARPLATNPLDDLSFAFDESRMEDDCWLCEFLLEHNLLPQYHGYNWAGILPRLPVLAGPERGIFQRDPGLTSGALCRGTCGQDCAEGSCDKNQRDLVVCDEIGDSHVWHTYVNYATCGTHQGCKDHDACYDMAYEMPVWGFGGYMIGPMFRACDLDAMCHYGFQQSVGWARGNGPYQQGRLRYADYAFVTQGCLGPCPQNVAEAGEEEVQQTCLEDRELLSNVRIDDQWGDEFFNAGLFRGSVPVPFIGRLTYGVNAMARADAEAFAELGPVDLQNACLTYDPASMTYSGTAELNLFANIGASASITAALEGFLSDPACFLNWLTLRGTMNAGVKVQLPTDLTAGVDLFCANGDLTVLPRVALKPCLDITGTVSAGLDVFLLSFNVWGQEWPLIQKTLQRCWEMEITFDPFVVGQMPTFNLVSKALAIDSLLGEHFEPASKREIDRTPARNPLPASPALLFPCLRNGDDDDDDDDDGPTAGCLTKATGADGRRLLTPGQRRPTWAGTQTVSIPGGGAAEVATMMEAPFLERTISGGSGTTDAVQKGIYKHVGLPQVSCFTTSKKDTQHFIKGHLLNSNIGGPGTEEKNLFPITAQANGDHKRQVEQGGVNVVDLVKGRDELIFYKVTVSGPSSPREIMDSSSTGTGFFEISATFLCEVADYQLCTDDTLRRNPSRFVPIPSRFVQNPSADKRFENITESSRCHERP